MGIEIRYATEAEFAEVAELDGANFGVGYDEDELADARNELHTDRLLVGLDGGRIVGVSAELPFEFTLPGGALVPATGVTWVSVEVTDRRRGVVRALMEHQIRAAAEAGDAAVLLFASEGGIYGRFGFGNSTVFRRTVVHRGRARFAERVDASAVRRLGTDAARSLLPEIYDRWRRRIPGGLSRSEQRWALVLRDRPSNRKGSGALLHLVHPDGYLTYRVKTQWDGGEPNGDCEIVDYVPGSPEAHAALWQTLLGLDLVARINSYKIPVDDPLPLLLTNPRAVDTTHWADGLWLRPTDVAALLGRRRYGLELDCVLAVRDPVLGDGRYHLQGGPDGATCGPTSAEPDLELDVADLGTLVMGSFRLGRLVRAGRVRVADPAVVPRLDLAFLAEREPHTLTQF